MSQLLEIQERFLSMGLERDQDLRIESIARGAADLAFSITSYCPPSRETSLAITKLEESVMWAIESIIRNE